MKNRKRGFLIIEEKLSAMLLHRMQAAGIRFLHICVCVNIFDWKGRREGLPTRRSSALGAWRDLFPLPLVQDTSDSTQ